jgi:hypothetical protein
MHAMHITKLYTFVAAIGAPPFLRVLNVLDAVLDAVSIQCIRELDRSRVPTFPDRHVPDCDSRHQHLLLVVVSRAHNHTPGHHRVGRHFLFRACIQAQHPDLPRPTSHAAIIHDRKFGSSYIDAVMRRLHAAVPGSYRVEERAAITDISVKYCVEKSCMDTAWGTGMGALGTHGHPPAKSLRY